MAKEQKDIGVFNEQCEQLISQAQIQRDVHYQCETALELFNQASEQGYPLGWYWVAYAHMPGNGFGLNLDNEAKSVALFNNVKKAANQGNAIGEYALGLMCEKGRGVKNDMAKALLYYRRSAEQGYIVAQNTVAMLYERGYRDKSNNQQGIQQHYQEAAYWYEHSAMQNNALGQFSIGRLYQDGHIQSHDNLAKATLWYREAVINGEESAWDRLERLKDKGHPEVQCVYGELRLASTLKSDTNYQLAYDYLKLAADQGHRRARCYLGLMHEYGLVEKQPPSQQAALFLYTYHTKLDMEFELQQIIIGISYLRRAKYCGSCYHEDKAYTEFFQPLKEREMSTGYQYYNYSPVIVFLEKEANKSKLGANMLLVIVYAGGLLGVQKDLSKAETYLNFIEHQGDAWLQCSIGYFYEQGYLFDKDSMKANHWYQLAANKGLLLAQIRLKIDPSQRSVREISSSYMTEKLPLGFRMGLGKSARSEDSVNASKVKVIKEFKAQNISQLSVKEGDNLRVIRYKQAKKWDSDWWHCQSDKRQEGLVPSNHLTIIERAEAHPVCDLTELPKTALAINKEELELDKEPLSEKGAFGIIYKGTWCATSVAVKVSRNAAYPDEETLSDANRELKMMANLHHPNIVKLCAYTKTEGRLEIPMFVMEYMDRGTLFSHFGENPYGEHLPYLIRYSIALNVGEGLRYLHHKQLVHRDLKSENVLLCTYQGNPYFAKIADFGLSVMQKTDIGLSFKTVVANKPIGTPYMMAPEILQSGIDKCPFNKKTDIYSFALILYELMHYRRPYENKHMNELVNDVAMKGYREPISQNAPAAFKQATRQGWAQLPENRPTIDTLMRWLRHGVNEEQKAGKGKAEARDEFEYLSMNRFSVFGNSGLSESESILLAEQLSLLSLEHEQIGLRNIDGFIFRDEPGDDNGNCFYIAAAEQMLAIGHPYLQRERLPGNESWSQDVSELAKQLRCYFKGDVPKQGQWTWADDRDIAIFAMRTNSVIGIISTYHDGRTGPLDNGFTGYYPQPNNPSELQHYRESETLPANVPVLRLGYTGNHYMSVRQHPDLASGILQTAYTLPTPESEVMSVVCN